jgi:hypothetical protein
MHHGVEGIRGDAVVVALSHTVIGQILLMAFIHGRGSSIAHWCECILALTRPCICASTWTLSVQAHTLRGTWLVMMTVYLLGHHHLVAAIASVEVDAVIVVSIEHAHLPKVRFLTKLRLLRDRLILIH